MGIENKFWVQVYEVDESTLRGVITAIIKSSVKRELVHTGIGKMSFTIPQSVFADISFEVGLCLWFPALGWKYYVDTWEYNNSNDTVTISCLDEMVKLTWTLTHFNGTFSVTDDKPVTEVIASTIDDGMTRAMRDITSPSLYFGVSWPAYYIHEYNSTTPHMSANSAAETYMQFLQAICKFYGAYFVLTRHSGVCPNGGAITQRMIVKIGFFMDSPIQTTLYNEGQYILDKYLYDPAKSFINNNNYANWFFTKYNDPAYAAYTPTMYYGGPNDVNGFGTTVAIQPEEIPLGNHNNDNQYVIIKDIKQTSVGTEIINELHILGGGIFPFYDAVGDYARDSSGKTYEAPLTVCFSSKNSPYPKSFDGFRGYWKMQAVDSSVWPQVRRKTVYYKDIIPITSSVADLQLASNMLYDIGAYILDRYKNPSETYSISCTGDSPTLLPTSFLRVEYKRDVQGPTGKKIIKDISGYFYITGISISYDDAGNPTFDINISKNGMEELAFETVMVDAFNTIKNLVAKVQPSLTYFNWPSPSVAIQGVSSGQRKMNFPFYMDSSVYAIHELIADVYVSRRRTSGFDVKSANLGDLDVTDVDLGLVGRFPSDWSWPHVHGIPVYPAAGSVGLGTPDVGIYRGSDPQLYQPGISTLAYNIQNPNDGIEYIRTMSQNQYGYIYDPSKGGYVNLGPPDIDIPITIKKGQTAFAGVHGHDLIQTIVDDAPSNMADGLVFVVNGLSVPMELDSNASTDLLKVFRVNLTDYISASDFRNKWHKIVLYCLTGAADVFLNVRGRLTIVPMSN